MLSQSAKELFEEYEAHADAPESSELVTTIHVDEVAAQVARFYERVRNVIEYKEEHLLRKHVIERMLKRRIFLKDLNGDIAEPLIKDIIRSGHLPNDTIPESKIAEVQLIIENLLALLETIRKSRFGNKKGLTNWLVTITVSAIEETLAPPTQDRLLADMMFKTLKSGLVIKGRKLKERDVHLQTFIATQRALLMVDRNQLEYRLLQFVYPNWNTLRNDELEDIAHRLPKIKESIEHHLTHPLAPQFLKLGHRYNIVFWVIGDLIYRQQIGQHDTEEMIADETLLEKGVKTAYQKRYGLEKKRLRRLALLSVISFLLSKIAVALAIEIPIDYYIFNEFSASDTIINILVPPLLMLLIVMNIRLPSKKNVKLVESEVRSALFDEHKKSYLIQIAKKRGWFTHAIVNIVYLATFVVSLFLLTKLLLIIGFSTLNIIIFILFFSMIVATGVKVYNRAKEISLEKTRSNFITFIVDLFALPFITIGRWVIAGLAKFNIFVLLTNFLVELPFQFFIEFVENLRGFIKSKKEEIT